MPDGPSHSYELPRAGLLRVLGLPLAGCLAWVVLAHAAAVLRLLPTAVPLDLDRTILTAKARLARAPEPSRIVLAGDSSCLMDVDARHLGERLGTEALNLGTLSYLGLREHGGLLKAFADSHPGSPATVVLLLHPEALRRSEAQPAYVRFLATELGTPGYAGAGFPPRTWPGDQPDWLGGAALRERLLPAVAPPLLAGDFGPTYGTTRKAFRHLLATRGSLVDPTRFDGAAERGNPEYRLSRTLEEASQEFRASLPQSARLVVGLTPAPRSLVGANHEATARGLLLTWAGWLRADQVLTNLPTVLPDDQFATLTHLNARGAAAYTGQLAAALGRPDTAP